MEKQTQEEVELKRYLLGECGQEERMSIDERLFLDGDYLLRLQALEDELIDDYVYGDLPSSEQDKVETQLLSRPGRHEDLKFARELRKYLDVEDAEAVLSTATDTRIAPPPPPEKTPLFYPSLFRLNPVVAYSLAATALVVLTLVGWQVSEVVRRRNNPIGIVDATPTEQPTPTGRQTPPGDAERVQADERGGGEGQPDQRPGPSQIAKGANENQVAERSGRRPRQRPHSSPFEGRQPSPAVTVLLLPTAVVRGEGAGNVVRVSSDVGTVNLQLPLVGEGDGYKRYKATLRTGGRTIRVWSNLKPATTDTDKLVEVSVPARRLRPRNYQLRLAGLTDGGQTRELITYSFQVQDK